MTLNAVQQDAIANTYEPRKQFRFIFDSDAIPKFLVREISFSSNEFLDVSFCDTDELLVFEKLLENSLSARPNAYKGVLQTLGKEGQLYGSFDVGRLKLVSVTPRKLDYSSNEPVIFDAVFQRLDK